MPDSENISQEDARIVVRYKDDNRNARLTVTRTLDGWNPRQSLNIIQLHQNFYNFYM